MQPGERKGENLKNLQKGIPGLKDLSTNISSVVEFQRWCVLKSKVFGQESTYSKEIVVFYEYNELRSVKKCQNHILKISNICTIKILTKNQFQKNTFKQVVKKGLNLALKVKKHLKLSDLFHVQM